MQLFMRQTASRLPQQDHTGAKALKTGVRLARPQSADLFVAGPKNGARQSRNPGITARLASPAKVSAPKVPQHGHAGRFSKTSGDEPFRPKEEPPLAGLSQELAAYYQAQLPSVHHQMSELLGAYGVVTGRAKTADSILHKLLHGQSGPRSKSTPRIPDGIGTRLILTHGHPGEVEAVVNALTKAVQGGQFKIQSIHNYRGSEPLAYFNAEQVHKLVKAVQHAKQERYFVGVSNGPEAIKASGYTALQLKIRHSNGVHGELQIRGPRVDQVAEREHQLYSLRQGKAKHPKNPFRLGSPRVNQLEKTLQSLSEQEHADYLGYIREHYENARKLEMGPSVAHEPAFPPSLDQYPELKWPDSLNSPRVPTPLAFRQQGWR